MSRYERIGEHVLPIQTWNPVISTPAGEFTYVDLGAVDQTTKQISGARQAIGREAPSRARQLIKSGDVLVATVRPNLNAVALVPSALDGATASTGFTVLRANETTLSSLFLSHWVKTPHFVSEMVRRATGASYPAVSDRIVLESSLPLPALDEQRRIAAILDQAEALRAKRRQALAKLDTLTQSLFLEMFGDPNFNRKRMRLNSLGEVIRLKSGQFLPANAMAEDGKFPVYGGNGINGHHDEFMFETAVISLGRVGVYCGIVHVTKSRSWITDNALYVSEIDPSLEFGYLATALKIARLNQYASRAAQPLLSGSRIYPVEIMVPPIDLQRSFAARVSAVEQHRSVQTRSERDFQRFFDCLQHGAFQGEL